MLNLGKETYTPQLKVTVAQIFAQGLLSCQIPFECAQTIKCTVPLPKYRKKTCKEMTIVFHTGLTTACKFCVMATCPLKNITLI